MEELIHFEINNKNYGTFPDIELYITAELKRKLEAVPIKQQGNLFNIMETRGFRGGKHLIESIRSALKGQVKIVLSHTSSRIDGNTVVVDYEKYDKLARREFFPIYRKTGMNTANKFIQEELKGLKLTPIETISKKDTEAVLKTLPKFEKIADKTKSELFLNLAQRIRETDIDVSKVSEESLREIKAASAQAYLKKQIRVLKLRLQKNYPETKGKSSWQSWIYDNIWLFGSNYAKAIPKEKVGFQSIPDFLFPTVDGFVDIMEIKKPKFLIIKKDSSHAGAYYWDTEVNSAIGQVVNYFHEIELHQLEIAKKLKLSTIKPRAIILVGRTDKWDEEKKEALRKLNNSLHSIEVLSYDQILLRADRLVKIYDKDYGKGVEKSDSK